MVELQITSPAPIPVPQHIAMPLIPRSIVDLRDDKLDSFVVRIVDVEQIQRTHVVAEVPQLCEQADRANRHLPRLASDDVTNFIGE